MSLVRFPFRFIVLFVVLFAKCATRRTRRSPFCAIARHEVGVESVVAVRRRRRSRASRFVKLLPILPRRSFVRLLVAIYFGFVVVRRSFATHGVDVSGVLAWVRLLITHVTRDLAAMHDNAIPNGSWLCSLSLPT
jgi:hypothetical protein